MFGHPLVHITYVKAARLLINQIVTGGASEQHLIIYFELTVMKLMTTMNDNGATNLIRIIMMIIVSLFYHNYIGFDKSFIKVKGTPVSFECLD